MATKQRDELYERLRGLLLLPIAGAWLAGIYISALFSWLSTPLLVCAALTLIGTVFSLLSRHKLAWLPLLCLFSLLLGAWRYSMSAPGHDPGAISQLIGIPQLRLRGTVSDEPRFTGRSRTLVVSVDSVNNGSQWLSVTGQIELQVTGTAIEDPYGANYGDSVEITGALQSAPPHSAPDILASMAFPRVHVSSHGGNPLLVYLHHLRITLATLITQSLPQPAAAMLIALVLGLSTPTLKPLTAIFTVTGTTHILVASGFNVTLVSGMVRGAMRWLDTPPGTTGQDLLPAQHQGSWRRWLVTILVLCSIAIYSVLNGAGPAAIRAGIMGALLVLAPRLGRIYNVYTGLATTAVAMSLMNPFILWDIGFQLSFCSTLGIVLFTPHLQRLIQRFIRFPLLGEPLAVTIAAQLATLPIIAITFQQVSLISPIANLLIEPFLGVLTLAGMLLCACSVLYAPLGVLCGWAIFPLLWYIIQAITFCANIPGAYINLGDVSNSLAWVYYAILCIVTCGLLRSRPEQAVHPIEGLQQQSMFGLSRRVLRIAQAVIAMLIILATGITALATPASRQLSISFLAVGPPNRPYQGEAILIRTPDNKTLLIDGGPDAASLAWLLDSRLPSWQRSLDVVLLTVPLRDHITGLFDVITRYAVGTVIDAGALHPSATYATWRRIIDERKLHYLSATKGMTIPLGQVALQVLWPSYQLHKGSDEGRDNGLVVRLISPGLRVLFLGEGAQSKYALSRLASTTAPAYLQAEIVQIVGTAGKPSLSELTELLPLIHPALLVITPAAPRPAQHTQAPNSDIPLLTTPAGANWQTVQIAQGTVEITAGETTWSMAIL